MNKKTLIAFIVSFVFLLVVIILNRRSFYEMKLYSEAVDHTRQVITGFESISNHFKSAQIYSTHLEDSTGKELYQLYRYESGQIKNELLSLRKLINDNADQEKLVDSLSSDINNELGVLMQYNIAEIIRNGESWRLDTYKEIHDRINRGIANEEKLLVSRKAGLTKYTSLYNLLSTAFAVLAVTIIFIIAISNFMISKRRRWLEGFLESILDTSQNGIAYYKAVRQGRKIVDFRVEFVNQAVDKLLNLKSDEIIGKKLSEFPSIVREQDLFKKYVEVVDSGTPMDFEVQYADSWFLVSLAPMDDGVTATFHNISQLKKFEAELKQNITDLERSNMELEQYAYVASHDLQEPLRKIRSFGSYLQETQHDRLDEKGRQQLAKILQSAERMSELIRDILSFSSMDKMGSMKPTDLNEVLKYVILDLDLLITQKHAVIESEPLPVIEAITLQMNQLFYNLMNNSLKFSTQDRQPLIRVSCRILPENEKTGFFIKELTYYEIIFSDNGIGFGPEYEEQIFGLFKRLNDKQVYPGSGIGLALCKKVVENHKGMMKAKGRENEGASFYIYLPQKQPASL